MDKFTPESFTKMFPKYVYRDGKGRETVQWREAALDMANDRAKLVTLLSVVAQNLSDRGATRQWMEDHARALLRELGEE